MNTSTKSKTSFIMPDKNVTITPNWTADTNLQYITIDRSGAVSASSKLKGFTANGIIDLVIPAEIGGVRITSIGFYGFQVCNALRTVTVSEGITDIAQQAFGFCNGLASVSIPSTVKSIFYDSFLACDALTTININNGRNTISGSPWGAFNARVNWLG